MAFYQLDHEKQFTFNMKGLFVVNTVYVASFLILGEFLVPGSSSERVSFAPGSSSERVSFDPGSSSERVSFLEDVEVGPEDEAPLGLLFHRVPICVTILVMVGSELLARLMRPKSTAVHPMPVPTNHFVVVENNVPFSSLNLSIVLAVIVIIVRDVVFNAFGARGIPISVVLATLLLSNKKARKHVLLRLRQKLDAIAVGGNNTVHPVVEIALAEVRDQMDDSAPRHNAAQIYMV